MKIEDAAYQGALKQLAEQDRRIKELENAIQRLYRVYSMAAGGVLMHDAMTETISLVRNES